MRNIPHSQTLPHEVSITTYSSLTWKTVPDCILIMSNPHVKCSRMLMGYVAPNGILDILNIIQHKSYSKDIIPAAYFTKELTTRGKTFLCPTGR